MKLRLSSFDRPSNRFTWKVRIIVNSQPYPEITTDLKFFPSRDISTFIEQRNSDIEMFIWKKIRDLSLQKGYYCRLKIETPNILKVNVGGSFLGIGLMCDEMKKLDIQNAPAFPENVAPGPFPLWTNTIEKASENERKRGRICSILAVVIVACWS